MEQNLEHRNKSKHIWSINIRQENQENAILKRQSFQQTVLG